MAVSHTSSIMAVSSSSSEGYLPSQRPWGLVLSTVASLSSTCVALMIRFLLWLHRSSGVTRLEVF